MESRQIALVGVGTIAAPLNVTLEITDMKQQSKVLSTSSSIMLKDGQKRVVDVPAELFGAVQAALHQAGLEVHPYIKRGVTRFATRYSNTVPASAFVPSFLRFTGDSTR